MIDNSVKEIQNNEDIIEMEVTELVKPFEETNSIQDLQKRYPISKLSFRKQRVSLTSVYLD